VRNYSRLHLSRPALARQLVTNTAGCNEQTADQLADIAEFDERRQYLEESHPSMTSYCIHVLHLSDDSARKRIHAARAARQYPAIFEMVADGRLNLSGVVMLAPYLSPAHADELLAAAAFKTRLEIDQLLDQRFSRASQPMLPPVCPPEDPCEEHPNDGSQSDERAPGRVHNETVESASAPVSLLPARSPWPITVDPTDHEKLRYAQSLLRHRIPSGDMTKVLSRLIDLGLAQLEKQRTGAGLKPRVTHQRSSNPRSIPNAVKHAVWKRDGGQCTFTSESGHRCPAMDFIEFDHAVPVARRGMATVENLRLRCRAHNQYEAERTFGTEFMRHKRTARNPAPPPKAKPEAPPMSAAAAEVVPWLRGLGFKIAEANTAASLCEDMASEPLEKRVRVALSYFRKSSGATVAHAVT
jgi:hypothetical protein